MAQAPQVDFYVTADRDAEARLRLACRVTEKAYLAGHQVLVWCPDAALRERFDALLWTFADRSFVPHACEPGTDAPVRIAGATPPADSPDVLVNLATEVPEFAPRAARILEFIDGDATARDAGRRRFAAYRTQGMKPATHQVREGASI